MLNEAKDAAYCEEEFQELRLGNIMLRQIGPCQRCKTTTLNWERNERHPESEPLTTLVEKRRHPQYGPIFGVYWQPDIIETRCYFRTLLSGYPEPSKLQMIPTIINKSDLIFVRVRKRTYHLSERK